VSGKGCMHGRDAVAGADVVACAFLEAGQRIELGSDGSKASIRRFAVLIAL